eukprot:TRINITY_DN9487_c0_g2_i2.p1 TRINITY_DN9487_c0_g2~~TRINITY_DN9487_c0_g2_i2.p1  ORF type:complete len:835 (-),score=113.91 TRINITY_DN9487_c0_g2_i2:533-3037(-)
MCIRDSTLTTYSIDKQANRQAQTSTIRIKSNTPFCSMDLSILLTETNYETDYKGKVKTDEEIKQFLIDETMSDFKRCQHIFNRGTLVQKIALCANLHRMILDTEVRSKFLPILSSDLHGAHDEMLDALADSMKKILGQKILSPEEEGFVFKMCYDAFYSSSPKAVDSWVQVYGMLMASIPPEVYDKEHKAFVINMLDPLKPTMMRYAGARILGFYAEVFGERIRGQLLEKSRLLCHDQEDDLRQIMANEVIEKICIALGGAEIEYAMMDKINELVYDKRIEIKVAAIDLVLNLLPIFPENILRIKVCPQVVELMTNPNELVIKTLSKKIGSVLLHGHDIIVTLSSNALFNFMGQYQSYAGSKDVEVQKNFLYNFPGINQITTGKFYHQLKKDYLTLGRSEDKNLRITFIAGLHEVLKIIGAQEANRDYREIILQYLKDNDRDVALKFFENLPYTMEQLSNTSLTDKENIQSTIPDFRDNAIIYLKGLAERAESLSKINSWRVEYKFLEMFPRIAKYYKTLDLNEYYVPILFRAMKNGSLEVRKIAVANLIKFLRSNSNAEIRGNILNRLYDEGLFSPSYQMRLNFIEFCHLSTLAFSKKFVKQFILEKCLTLVHDKVRIVKKKLAAMMQNLRDSINTYDFDALERFESSVSKLLDEKDPEISKLCLQLRGAPTGENKADNYLSHDGDTIERRRLSEEGELEFADETIEVRRNAKNQAIDYQIDNNLSPDTLHPRDTRRRNTYNHSKLPNGSIRITSGRMVAVKPANPKILPLPPRALNSRKSAVENGKLTMQQPPVPDTLAPNRNYLTKVSTNPQIGAEQTMSNKQFAHLDSYG